MSVSLSSFINGWCAQPVKRRRIIYILFFILISVCESVFWLYRPLITQRQQEDLFFQKEGKLALLFQQYEEVKKAESLLTAYQSISPSFSDTSENMSLYQTHVMAYLQHFAGTLNIDEPDIQLKDCQIEDTEKLQAPYCEMWVAFKAENISAGRFIEKILTCSWMVMIRGTEIEVLEDRNVRANLRLALVFPDSDNGKEEISLSQYEMGLKEVSVRLDTSAFHFILFPDKRKNKTDGMAFLPTEDESHHNEEGIGRWRYDGIIKKRKEFVVHLSHDKDLDIWLHKDELLFNSSWRLKNISMEALVFVNQKSQQTVRVIYCGEIL